MGSGGRRSGWTRVAFGDVVRLNTERASDPEAAGFSRYVGLEHINPGDLTIHRWGNVSDGTTFTNVFRPGQVLFGKRRAYQRKVAAPDFSGVCSSDIYVLESKDNRHLLPELLPFVCQTDAFFKHAVGTSAGSLSPRTNWQSLATYEVALPPLDEQRQIANLLHASTNVRYAIGVLVNSIENSRQSLIDAVAEDIRHPSVRIEDLCEIQNGRPFPRSEYVGEGIRLLRPGNLDSGGYLSWKPSKTICLPERWKKDASDFIVENGNILINLTAQSLDDRFMGRVCIARADDTSLLNQRIGRFRGWSTRILPEYVFRVLQSSRFQRHVIGMCEGSKVKHLFWSHIRRFVLQVPPIREQQVVIEMLQLVDNMLHAVIERIKKQQFLHELYLLELGTTSNSDALRDL